MSAKTETPKPDTKPGNKKKLEKAKYVIFPLWIIEGADIERVHETAYSIFCYVVYGHAVNKIDFGTIERKIASAATYYGIYLHEHDRRVYNIEARGKELHTSKKPLYPTTSIPIKKLIEFINFNGFDLNRAELEGACFLAYCSLRSIVQKSPFKQLSKIQIISRMSGSALKMDETALPAFLTKYLNRYHFDNLKWELSQKWEVSFYGLFTRGIYVSFVLDQKNLIRIIEKNRKQYLIDRDRKNQLAAREQALKEINQKSNDSN